MTNTVEIIKNSILWRDLGSDLQFPDYRSVIGASMYPPIIEAKVSMNGTKQIPRWIKAKIYRNHLCTGEGTNQNLTLRDEIRSRGNTCINNPDDCGHMIACSLGGKMVEFNLFPQDLRLNRGWSVQLSDGSKYPCGRLWKKGVEYAIKNFLRSTPQRKNPRVYFQIRLNYGDQDFPNRPDSIEFAVKFKKNEEEDEDEETEENRQRDVRCVSRILEAKILNVALQENTIDEGIWESSEYSAECMELALQILLAKLIEASYRTMELRRPQIEVPRPRSPLVQRDFSWWDVVPIVGSVRDVMRGVDDFEEGRVASGIFNTTLGVGGLALDVLSLGAFGSITKTAAKEGSKQTGRAVAKEMAKQTGKAIVKEGAEVAAKAAVKEGAGIAVRAVTREAIHRMLPLADKFIDSMVIIMAR